LCLLFSTKQWAATIVHAYPYMPDVEDVLEATAKASGNISKDAVLDDCMMGSMAAEWDALQEYLEHITVKDMHAYVPFSAQSAVFPGASVGGQAASRMPFACRSAISKRLFIQESLMTVLLEMGVVPVCLASCMQQAS